ncbi:PilW family protein [Neptunomonas antarctica]|uniref:MSHA biogenesis protein MshO n=1 Tax=Neptunomonas antarctica TaxID=619304 RepID=A0A1N7MMM6_9GAMM|nr:type II secretion system protein [Neptunomonas antarctica]SIS87404.1 MSHA biogenesis protein MshO [Neptunomonas antarctica]
MCASQAHKQQSLQKCSQKGFTLLELIVVIVLLGIISVGTTGFIVNSVKGYTDMARRDGIAATSRVAMDRMVRELRNALPNSPRVITDGGPWSGLCLEYIPILDATSYLSIPIASSATSFSIIPFTEAPELGKAAIYPINTDAVYQTGSPAVISPDISSSADSLVGSGATTLELSSAHQYPEESPAKRMFIVDGPVSFCLVGDRLYRYSHYDRTATQPTPDTLPALPGTEPNRALLAYPLTGTQPFTIENATLQRNALVILQFSVEQGSEKLLIQQEVHTRNAP